MVQNANRFIQHFQEVLVIEPFLVRIHTHTERKNQKENTHHHRLLKFGIDITPGGSHSRFNANPHCQL